MTVQVPLLLIREVSISLGVVPLLSVQNWAHLTRMELAVVDGRHRADLPPCCQSTLCFLCRTKEKVLNHEAAVSAEALIHH